MKSNITPFIQARLELKLHNQKNHPIEIMKNHIYNYFTSLKQYKFDIFDDLNHVVSIEDNFDKLLIPKDHPARSLSDTYYVDENYVLRTHTSAHQNELLAKGYEHFLVTGNVFRKDEIDCHHYPIFHQMEMLVISKGQDPITELKNIISGLVNYLFPGCEYRFNDDYFPFTNPSFETEVKYNDKWIEILGCGVVRDEILQNNGISKKKAVAVGFGLDRLVMIFTQMDDIRQLWSNHKRFLDQYADGTLKKFEKYSLLCDIHKDISFYISKDFEENDMMDIIRNFDDVKEVKLISTYFNEKLAKESKTYRIVYSPIDPSFINPAEFNKHINKRHALLVESITNLNVELR